MNSMTEEKFRTKLVQEKIYEILLEFHNICEMNNLTYILDYGTLLGAVRHQGFIPWDDDIDVSMPREDYCKFVKIMKEIIRKKETKLFLQTNESDKNYYIPLAKLRIADDKFRELSLSPFDIVHGPWIDIFVFDNVPKETAILKENIHKFNKKRKFIDYITPVPNRQEKSVKNLFKEKVKNIVIKLLKNNNRVFYKILDYKYEQLNNTIKDCLLTGSEETNQMITYTFSINNKKDFDVNTMRRESFEERLKIKFEDDYFYIPKNYDEVLTRRYGKYMQLPPKSERKSNHYWDIF